MMNQESDLSNYIGLTSFGGAIYSLILLIREFFNEKGVHAS